MLLSRHLISECPYSLPLSETMAADQGDAIANNACDGQCLKARGMSVGVM